MTIFIGACSHKFIKLARLSSILKKSLKCAQLTSLLNHKSTRDGDVRGDGNAAFVSSLRKEEEGKTEARELM
jgi:hypothetical protein